MLKDEKGKMLCKKAQIAFTWTGRTIDDDHCGIMRKGQVSGSQGRIRFGKNAKGGAAKAMYRILFALSDSLRKRNASRVLCGSLRCRLKLGYHRI
jgi:hypothetical protein